MAECPIMPSPSPRCPTCNHGGPVVEDRGNLVIRYCPVCRNSFSNVSAVTDDYDQLFTDLGGEG